MAHDCNHKCPMFNDEMAGRIIAGLSAIETDLKGIKKHLFGNGQPGKCQIHGDAIEEIKISLAEDKGRRSVLTVITAFITALMVAGFSWFLGKH